MRLDHIAFRVCCRHKTAQFFSDTLGYTIGTEFQIEFDDHSKADCIALVPPENRHPDTSNWIYHSLITAPYAPVKCQFHTPPEIFVSDGPEGSIVGDWVRERQGIGGVHHLAYCVSKASDVKDTMEEWKEKGYAEFLSEEPLTCPGLTQVFTKPSQLTGVIIELIHRTGAGFCKDNVRNLMLSTVNS